MTRPRRLGSSRSRSRCGPSSAWTSPPNSSTPCAAPGVRSEASEPDGRRFDVAEVADVDEDAEDRRRGSSPVTSTGSAGRRSSSSGPSAPAGTSRSGRSSSGSAGPRRPSARVLDGHHDRAPVPGRGAPEDRAVPADHGVPDPAPVGRSPSRRTTPRRAIAVARTDHSHDGAALSVAVEVDRVVNASGLVALSGRYVSVGQALAGRRVTLRLDGDLAHVIDDGVLVRTLPAPVPPALRRRLHGVRLAGPTGRSPPDRYGCSGASPAAASPRSPDRRCASASPTGTPWSTSTSTRASSTSTTRPASSWP